jgi:mRNA interferase MazF
MKQYEIWWAEFPAPLGTRPVLLLSRDTAYQYLRKVLAVEITTRVRGIPQEILLGPREGLPRKSAASLDNLRRVSTSRLVEHIGRLAPWRADDVKRALGHTLGWPELTNL